MKNQLDGFMEFVRNQGVVGLAIGLVLGGAVGDLVKSFINAFINPLLGLLLNSAAGLKEASFTVAGASVKYGDFLNTFINFVVIAAVIYFGVKKLGLDKLDKKAE